MTAVNDFDAFLNARLNDDATHPDYRDTWRP